MKCYWFIFFFKQKTAYEMRISDWSSDVCSSDLVGREQQPIPADPVDGVEDMLARLRLLHRLRGQPDLPADVLGRQHRKVRRLVPHPQRQLVDRKSVVKGTSVSVRVDLGGRRNIKKKKYNVNQDNKPK